jgi:hypothetical protein
VASYVIIWENNTFGHQKVNGHTWPGHAAMNIGEHFHNSGDPPAQNSYVSWWPTGGTGFGVKDVIKAFVKDIFKPQEGRMHLTFYGDVNYERYLPDHIIRLESTEQNEDRMRAAWKAVLDKDSSYKSLRKNCSTIVSRVLHAGGYYARKWALDCNFAWTPADVKKVALRAGGDLMRWADFLEVIKDSGIIPNGWPTRARSGRMCSTGAPVQFQQAG